VAWGPPSKVEVAENENFEHLRLLLARPKYISKNAIKKHPKKTKQNITKRRHKEVNAIDTLTCGYG